MGVSVPKPSLIHDSLSNRDLKSCNDWWWCISSPPNLCVSPSLEGGWQQPAGFSSALRAFLGRCSLTFLTRAKCCQGQSHNQQCQHTPHVFFGCASLPNLRAFLEVIEVLRGLFLGSSLYPVICWRDQGSGLCSCVCTPKQTPSLGPGDTGSWQSFWHPSHDSGHFQKILSEVLNGAVEEKQLDLKNHLSYKLESHSVMLESQGKGQHTLKSSNSFHVMGLSHAEFLKRDWMQWWTFPPPNLDSLPWG